MSYGDDDRDRDGHDFDSVRADYLINGEEEKMEIIDTKVKGEKGWVVVPAEVRRSDFGCANCLYASGECKAGEMYKPNTYNGQPSCLSYVYYD